MTLHVVVSLKRPNAPDLISMIVFHTGPLAEAPAAPLLEIVRCKPTA